MVETGIFHLFDMAIVNAYILYRMSSQPGRKLDHKTFRIELAKSSLGGTDSLVQNPTPHQNVLPPQACLTERHFPEVPSCASGRASQPVCMVCSNKRGRGKRTTTYPDVSSVIYLPCFELYHTKADPVRHLEQLYFYTNFFCHHVIMFVCTITPLPHHCLRYHLVHHALLLYYFCASCLPPKTYFFGKASERP